MVSIASISDEIVDGLPRHNLPLHHGSVRSGGRHVLWLLLSLGRVSPLANQRPRAIALFRIRQHEGHARCAAQAATT